MAEYLGKDGYVFVGSDLVGESRGWSVEETAETIDTTVAGDTTRTFSTTYNNWTATVDVLYDAGDTAQTALSIGSSVTVKFYPEPGSSFGTPTVGVDTELSGSAVVTGKTITSSYDGLIEASISLQGDGVLTYGTA